MNQFYIVFHMVAGEIDVVDFLGFFAILAVFALLLVGILLHRCFKKRKTQVQVIPCSTHKASDPVYSKINKTRDGQMKPQQMTESYCEIVKQS